MLMAILRTTMAVLLSLTLLIAAPKVLPQDAVQGGQTDQPVNAAATNVGGKGEAEEPAWGEPVEGVQARLRSAKTRWKADDVLTFQLDLWNQGDKPFSPVRQPTFCEIEFDGKWYIYGGMVQVNSPASSLPPGKQIDGWVTVVLDESWVRKTPDRVVGGAIQAKSEEWLSLTPGKHTVRVACASKVEPVRPISNIIEIDIPKGKENDAWGKAVGGIQARLRPKKQLWKPDDAPVFELDLRYDGEKPLLYAPRLPIFCEVEVDGTWYGWKLDQRIRARISEFAPHEQVNGWVAVSFDGSWLKGITGDDRNKLGDKGHPIRLAPAKHAIRVKFDPGLGEPSPISNAVEIEVKKAKE